MAHTFKQVRFFKASAILLFMSLGGLGGECSGVKNETDVTLAMTACKTGQAQISVLDGSMKNHCGCQESANQLVTNLTCTVPVGTTVFFNYSAAFLLHQIIPVGTPAIQASHLYDRSDEPVIPVFGFVLNGTAGDNYRFRDQFDPRLEGTFILVP
jgi:hypothetical protein